MILVFWRTKNRASL